MHHGCSDTRPPRRPLQSPPGGRLSTRATQGRRGAPVTPLLGKCPTVRETAEIREAPPPRVARTMLTRFALGCSASRSGFASREREASRPRLSAVRARPASEQTEGGGDTQSFALRSATAPRILR